MAELINCVKFKGKYVQVKYMLDVGAGANYKDKDGKTALHWCTSYNRPEFQERFIMIVSLLADRGADINATDNKGRTPLVTFIIENCSNDIIFIIACNTSPLITDSYRRTALHYYADYNGKTLKVCRKLMEGPGTVNRRDIHGNTPLMCFLNSGSERAIIELLLEANPVMTLTTKTGNTVFHYYAAWKYKIKPLHFNNTDVLDRLFDSTVERVNVRNSSGTSPLMLFVLHKLSPKDVEFLLDRGAEVNQEDQRGNTPLHLVFANPHLACRYAEVVQMLLEYGADPNAVNKLGETPLPLALQYNTVEYVELLFNYGLSRVLRLEFIGNYIKQDHPYSEAHQVVFKYMLLEKETALDEYLDRESFYVTINYPCVRFISCYHAGKSYIDSLKKEVRKMKKRFLVDDLLTVFMFAAETDRTKYCNALNVFSINNKVLDIEFPYYASVIKSKVKIKKTR